MAPQGVVLGFFHERGLPMYQTVLAKLLVGALLAWGIPDVVVEPPVTQADVLVMMSRIPVKGGHKPAGYERARDAPEIAQAIADTVDGGITGTLRGDAALVATFGAYESAYQKHAIGDGGKARGFLELQNVPAYIAFDPPRAIAAWLVIARNSLDVCRANPPGEELAALASGSCNWGRRVARTRWEISKQIAIDNTEDTK